MRISRDVLRPFVVLLVLVAAVPLVSTVGAYRASVTPDHVTKAPCPQADSTDSQAVADSKGQTCQRQTGRGEAHEGGDGDGDSEFGEHSQGSGGVVIVTSSGAS